MVSGCECKLHHQRIICGKESGFSLESPKMKRSYAGVQGDELFSCFFFLSIEYMVGVCCAVINEFGQSQGRGIRLSRQLVRAT